MTRAYNTATTQQNSGGAVAGVTAGKNPVLNSAFNVWQRGTSVAFGAYTYTADRWQAYNNASAATASQQVTGDTTNLPNIQYCARVQRNSGSSATNAIQFSQSFESINSIPFAGKTVTLSFYARKGANYSPTSDILNTTLYYGSGTDQRVLAGYTGGTAAINVNPVLTTTWQRFSYTATIASTATELGITFNHNPIGTAGAADYFEVTGVQLEVGSVATPYAPYSSTYQGELAACQRYYQRFTASGSTFGFFMVNLFSTSDGYGVMPAIVTLRTTPTLGTTGTASNYRIYQGGFASLSAISLQAGGTNQSLISFSATGSLTNGGGGWIAPDAGNNGYLEYKAEL
jgi:hypothetical protein